MIGVWRIGTKGLVTVGPQTHTQAEISSTLGVVANAGRIPPRIGQVLHVYDQLVRGIMQSCGKVGIASRLKWTSAGKTHRPFGAICKRPCIPGSSPVLSPVVFTGDPQTSLAKAAHRNGLFSSSSGVGFDR